MNETDICLAIRQMRKVQFDYEGVPRVVEPHLLGIMRNGTMVLCVYQVGGGSKSGKPVGWKSFIPEKIENWTLLSETFGNTEPGYNRDDTRMSRILCSL